MIAYHFPPQKGSSGIQRTLRFCRFLPEFGWRPVVLTIHPRAYEAVSQDQAADVPPGVVVRRAFGLDAGKHLSLRGRYPWFLTIPDRWSSWILGGFIAGLFEIWRHKPKVIFSTHPIASAHILGYLLHKFTRIPWVADFRDPMAQEGYPTDRRVWRSYKWIEEKALRHASRCLFTSPSAVRDYQATYPTLPNDKWILLENGYDEESMPPAEALTPIVEAPGRRLIVLHSGVVYGSERDPTCLFKALGILKRSGAVTAHDLEMRFRASSNDALLAGLAKENQIEDIISLAAPIAYKEALREMANVDALLLMQAANCNSQIPAKAYEYLRIGRPILTLTDAAGDTADLMRRAGLGRLAALESVEEIVEFLPKFLDDVRHQRVSKPDATFVANCDRKQRTRVLADIFRTVSNVPTR